MFLNGDVIINYSAMKFGGINLTYIEWAKYMALPTLIAAIIIMFAFILVFKSNLTDKFEFDKNSKLTISKQGKITLCITGLIILLWLTESTHGISAAKVSLIGVILMFSFKIIKLKDIKIINISLLIFLTAEFAIGKVLTGSGTVEKISNVITDYLPSSTSLFYIPFIILLIMVLHLIMGSLVTALSVSVPTLITITAGNLSPEFIVLLTCTAVCFHYILPFHHVTVMIGYGNGYFENRHTLKMGVALTIITIITVLFIYIPWWKLTGLL
jgi:di/tricarboxylate transporter